MLLSVVENILESECFPLLRVGRTTDKVQKPIDLECCAAGSEPWITADVKAQASASYSTREAQSLTEISAELPWWSRG
jgi:hypothetical protein